MKPLFDSILRSPLERSMEHLASEFSYYKWLAVVVEELARAANKRMSSINLEKKLSAQINWGGGGGGRNSIGDATGILTRSRFALLNLIQTLVCKIHYVCAYFYEIL